MFRAKETNPLGLEPEQQDKRARCPNIDWQGLVVETALQ